MEGKALPNGEAWNHHTWDWRRDEDGVWESGSAGRNAGDICAAHVELTFTEGIDTVLEVGSGTGQHIALFATAKPTIRFIPTELSSEGRSSIIHRTRVLANVATPFALDLLDPDFETKGLRADAVIAHNLFHVCNEQVMQQFGLLASQVGAKKVSVYGAFKRHGSHTTFSNNQFDTLLRKTDPNYGVRDLDCELAPALAMHGFEISAIRDMPNNNFFVLFHRST